MLVIDQAIAMLGPVEKVKGSPHIQDSVSNMKKVIEQSLNKPLVSDSTPCNAIVDGAYARLIGKDPFAPGLDRSNPFGDDSGFYLGDLPKKKKDGDDIIQESTSQADGTLPNLPGLKKHHDADKKKKQSEGNNKYTKVKVPKHYSVALTAN